LRCIRPRRGGHGRHFNDLLTTTFAQAFEIVVFAITDWSDEQRFIGPFKRVFRG
jgi:hypothetical protein